MPAKKKTGGVPDANRKTPPAVPEQPHGSQDSSPAETVKKKFWILEEIPPAEATRQAQTGPAHDGLSIADEATKLLDVGARIAARLDELHMVEVLASRYADVSTSPRQRAVKVRLRMNEFRSIYNAAWMVRHYQHSSGKPLEKAIDDFCVVLARELDQATDKEALLYAVADSLTISPYGVPWQN